MAQMETSEGTSQRFTRLQRVMIGNGVLLMFFALVAGVGLWVKQTGGFEVIPGTILAFDIPGTPEGWAMAHRGTPMNAIMVMAFALVLPHLGLGAKPEKWVAWIVVGAGWANTGFYYFGNFSQNRALTFGDNHFGPGSIESAIGLAPAYLFGVLSMGAMLYLAYRIFSSRD